MIGFSCRRSLYNSFKNQKFLNLSKRNYTVHALRYVESGRTSLSPSSSLATYKLSIPIHSNRIQLSITSNDTLATLESYIRKQTHSASVIEFSTIEGPRTSLLSKSEILKNIHNSPFLVSIDSENCVINLSEGHTAIKQVKREDIFEPNEEAFYMYSKSIGIPNKSSEILAAFLDKTYTSIPSKIASTEDIKASIFSALGAFRSLPTNKWGTTNVPDLKKILDKKEKELITMNDQKEKLDKKALMRANAMLYLGGTVLIGQFSFIMSGTYLFFCWDVMEPIAYLMLTSNLTAGFGYYWWTNSELEFQPLQGRFKSKIANGIYRRSRFDYEYLQNLQKDVNALRDLINNSV